MNPTEEVCLNSKNIQIRPWKSSDAKELSAIGNNPKIAINMTDGFPSPYTYRKAQDFIRKVNSQKRDLFYAIQYNDKLAGSISAIFFDDVYKKNVSIAYFVGESYWNNGVASTAIVILCRYLFNTYPIERIFAEPYDRNVASQKALMKAGFVKEATLKRNVFKNGEFIHSCIYSCFRNNNVEIEKPEKGA